jgi:cell wall-associated NlpC family hydrolase
MTPPFGSRVLIVAVCFLFFSFFAIDASGASKETSQAATPSCEVSKAAAAKAKSKTPVRPSGKSKRAASSKRKAKPQSRPIVSETTKVKAEVITSEISQALPESLENEISKFFGLRYRLGGEGQGGIDCSALVQKVYSEVFGIDLPRSSSQQSRLGNMESVTEDELQTGDLLFFGPKRRQVNHVGMYLAGGYFFHAARSEGVTISRLDDGYWKSRWMFSKRVKGLEIEYDSDGDPDLLERTLEQYSAGFAFAGDSASDTVSFLEGGIKINDSLEFLLTGFFLNTLDYEPQPLNPQSSESLQATENAETQSGFRLAAILSPLEWFKLIPSVTQIEGVQQEKGHLADHQKLGLETWMILPSSRIAVFMAAHAKNQEDFFESPLGSSPDLQTLDVALGLHYHLSDSLRFSLYGTHAYTPDLKDNSDDSGRRDMPLDDISFQFNIKF